MTHYSGSYGMSAPSSKMFPKPGSQSYTVRLYLNKQQTRLNAGNKLWKGYKANCLSNSNSVIEFLFGVEDKYLIMEEQYLVWSSIAFFPMTIVSV